jgi:hypothetical protein
VDARAFYRYEWLSSEIGIHEKQRAAGEAGDFSRAEMGETQHGAVSAGAFLKG